MITYRKTEVLSVPQFYIPISNAPYKTSNAVNVNKLVRGLSLFINFYKPSSTVSYIIT
jgi:hypothetical protein